MQTITATYSPEDNKLRLYASQRLDPETYAAVKAAGFRWAPKQELFVAPAWSPARADLAESLAGQIDDEDSSLTDRAEGRADRFEQYSDNRAADAESAHKAVSAICEGIPLGQPILVGHHSERRARKDAERIQNGMAKAVKAWEASEYWTRRAAAAIGHAKYKERPDVRARRIKTIEAELRKVQRSLAETASTVKAFERIDSAKVTRPDGSVLTREETARFIAGRLSSGYVAKSADGAFRYSAYDVLAPDGERHKDCPAMTVDQVIEALRQRHARHAAHAQRWIDHLSMRIDYEKAMLAGDGGTVADKTGPEKGGAVRCWASPRGGWSYIQKVNRVSVTVLDNWGNGGKNFTRTVPFDKLAGVMTAAQVTEARDNGSLTEDASGVGFYLLDHKPEPKEPVPALDAAPFKQMAESLKAGVHVVAAPQLFPTPPDIAAQMAELADIQPGQRILEPSAGTGNLIRAMLAAQPEGLDIVAVELNHDLAIKLSADGLAGFVEAGDFLKCNGDLGTFDRIVMNPPFQGGADIRHIQHAATMLRPGGRLVALCADGPRQRKAFETVSDSYSSLPPGSFKDQGTGVNVAMVVLTNEA